MDEVCLVRTVQIVSFSQDGNLKASVWGSLIMFWLSALSCSFDDSSFLSNLVKKNSIRMQLYRSTVYFLFQEHHTCTGLIHNVLQGSDSVPGSC